MADAVNFLKQRLLEQQQQRSEAGDSAGDSKSKPKPKPSQPKPAKASKPSRALRRDTSDGRQEFFVLKQNDENEPGEIADKNGVQYSLLITDGQPLLMYNALPAQAAKKVVTRTKLSEFALRTEKANGKIRYHFYRDGHMRDLNEQDLKASPEFYRAHEKLTQKPIATKWQSLTVKRKRLPRKPTEPPVKRHSSRKPEHPHYLSDYDESDVDE